MHHGNLSLVTPRVKGKLILYTEDMTYVVVNEKSGVAVRESGYKHARADRSRNLVSAANSLNICTTFLPWNIVIPAFNSKSKPHYSEI